MKPQSYVGLRILPGLFFNLAPGRFVSKKCESLSEIRGRRALNLHDDRRSLTQAQVDRHLRFTPRDAGGGCQGGPGTPGSLDTYERLSPMFGGTPSVCPKPIHLTTGWPTTAQGQIVEIVRILEEKQWRRRGGEPLATVRTETRREADLPNKPAQSLDMSLPFPPAPVLRMPPSGAESGREEGTNFRPISARSRTALPGRHARSCVIPSGGVMGTSRSCSRGTSTSAGVGT
jgi:hypothetical protein